MIHERSLRVLSISEVDFSDSLFESVRSEYADFEAWVIHARQTPNFRIAFAVQGEASRYGGLAICKLNDAQKRLKISTFKVASDCLGLGLGESLLTQVLAYAVAHMTRTIVARIPPNSDDAIRFFERAGFRREAGRSHRDEYIYNLDLFRASQSFGAINRLAYDGLAEEYKTRSMHPTRSQEAPEYLCRSLTDLLSDRAGRPILELGPGAGRILAALAKDGWSTVGIEISPRMAAIAQAQSPSSTIIVADVLDIDFPSGSFSGIYASAFFHLFPKYLAVDLIRRASRWLCDGGLIFINTTVNDGVDEGVDLKADYLRKVARYRARWDESEFLSIIDAAGLRVVHYLTTAEVERSKDWMALICAVK